ncbi:MAG: M50 family metallopeptidase [bacterium]|nr:M50 family metallopeptidase [bacterium]
MGEQATEDATGGEGRATEASGEASQIPGTPDRSFATRSFGERAAIVMAGIIGNVLLAAVLFSIAHGIGVATVVEGDETGFRNVAVTIVSVAPGSPAAEGGLKSGDNIVRIVDARGERLDPVRRVEEVQEFIQAHRGEPLGLSIERAKSTEELTVLPRLNAPEGEGALGIAMVRTGIRSYPWYEAVIQGVLTTIAFTELLVVGLASLFAALFTQGKLIADVAGPVGIAMLSREALLAGFAQLIFFTGVLSLNLGIINAFPFPALDGGRFMLLVIERLRGVPLSQRAETVIHTTGFAVLMLLMAAVTWRDIARIL